jgi:hypothetical protein
MKKLATSCLAMLLISLCYRCAGLDRKINNFKSFTTDLTDLFREFYTDNFETQIKAFDSLPTAHFFAYFMS